MRTPLLNPARLTKMLATLAILLSVPAFAGTRDSGGGTGLRIEGGKLVVLDLAEAGVENTASIPELTPDPAIVKSLQKNLKLPEAMKSSVLIPLAKKLTEIGQGTAQSAAMMMASAFGYYEYHTTSRKLAPTDDADSVFAADRVQLALRKGPTIYIHEPNWNAMDNVNRVALLLHEIIYAFQPLPIGCHQQHMAFGRSYTSCADATADAILMTSSKTRYMTGYFFRKDWQSTWKKTLAKTMAGSTYSHLFGHMENAHKDKTRVARHRTDEYKEDFLREDGTLEPVYSVFEVKFRGGTGLMTASTSVAQMTNWCVRAEMQEVSRWEADKRMFEYMSWDTMNRQKHPIIHRYMTTMRFEQDVITVKGEHGDSVSLLSAPAAREKCVEFLRKFKKSHF